jgi:hypothetical protein
VLCGFIIVKEAGLHWRFLDKFVVVDLSFEAEDQQVLGHLFVCAVERPLVPWFEFVDIAQDHGFEELAG